MPKRHAQPPRAEARPWMNPHAAGLDIGSEAIWACVPEDRDAQPVRSFGTCTPARLALAEWLVNGRLDTVAMASTGVYGMPG
jgi:transposase